MPTVRPRHQITETTQVSRALEIAAQRWPEDRDRPTRLVARLIDAGREAIEAGVKTDQEVRRRRIAALAGSMTGVDTGSGALSLKALRDEWPE